MQRAEDNAKWKQYVREFVQGAGVREAGRAVDYAGGVPSPSARDYGQRAERLLNMAPEDRPTEAQLHNQLGEVDDQIDRLRDEAVDIRRDIRTLHLVNEIEGGTTDA